MWLFFFLKEQLSRHMCRERYNFDYQKENRDRLFLIVYRCICVDILFKTFRFNNSIIHKKVFLPDVRAVNVIAESQSSLLEGFEVSPSSNSYSTPLM